MSTLHAISVLPKSRHDTYLTPEEVKAATQSTLVTYKKYTAVCCLFVRRHAVGYGLAAIDFLFVMVCSMASQLLSMHKQR